MSELKAYTHVAEAIDAETGKYALYAYDVNGNRTPIGDTELVYLKSEADNVIAELEESHKKEVAQLLLDIAELKQKNDESRYNIAVLRKDRSRQKYKRCLAMAKWCKLEQERIELIENQDITDDDFDKLVKGFYTKWHSRWLELAEKFKQN